ncbi:Uma2 family endonuclease [Calothrix sp. NIES-3974]|uniref:Uma2 family endonuclease n=1 Tax=Calothrix sp. NIES-3974 TaxID=2005462 RepID=UPI000B5FBD2B|nr:Uma2 family endonuclease [Calothrix sp. NIES-3974]BAZ05542.1 hypothetical protein NIES3974_21900 [Calothrix sp. NIES-3974]
MTITESPPLNLEKFLDLPETKPASEYFNGKIQQKPMPQGEHSLIQTTFCEVINGVAKSQKIAIAFPELRCTFDGQSLVPDVSVFRWSRIPRESTGRVSNRFEIPPDWIIEILSPNQNTTKVLTRIFHCLKNGTELGWLIDSENDSIFGVFPGQRLELYTGNSCLPVLEGIEVELTVEQVFGWLSL